MHGALDMDRWNSRRQPKRVTCPQSCSALRDHHKHVSTIPDQRQAMIAIEHEDVSSMISDGHGKENQILGRIEYRITSAPGCVPTEKRLYDLQLFSNQPAWRIRILWHAYA